jgi:predicted porin
MSRISTLVAVMAAAAAAVLASAGASAAEIKGAAYADLRYGIDLFETSGASAGPTDTNFENHGSYWGVKGSTSQDGITAFGGYERWLDTDPVLGLDLARQAYAGVMTRYGTVQYGAFATAYSEAGRKLDPFYATGAAGIGDRGLLTPTSFAGGQSHGQSVLNADQPDTILLGAIPRGSFATNQLAYTAPTLFGVTANVAVMFDDNAGGNEREDFAGGVEWTGMGITAGAQYLDANSAPVGVTNTGLAEDEEATRLYAGYSQQRFGANVSGERIDHNGGTPDADYLQLNGWFGVLAGTRLAASYGMEDETGAEGTSFRVGVFHDVVDNFTVHVVYLNFDAKPESGGTVNNPDDQTISLGASYRFELGASTTTH